ncbi:ferric-dicitrate binding protein FerR (iron transport regulator) [Dysgonomonas hofstadii]|uniref:Ferric-dicitrate binding protein FerR (Iron transport regulator) n=1 Tax=Dysgonomonas hofstadii TaxID=637886 RepID=A0A840CLQ8_9BACT|nr:FecR family protein [Dysgonomonas hofstadii]MBB4036306.1 ferric-dicitrate binding protein FerR (iron transport regulator) [Dysgonomonas hofstadii]
MKKLETKYKQNNINSEELEELRNIVNNLPDSKLEDIMYESWLHDSIDEDVVSEEQLREIKHKVNRNIYPTQKRVLPFRRIMQVAASILIPVLLLATGYLYYENKSLAEQEMIVSTTKGERANIVLPDGTKVALNSESQLRYAPQAYGKKERKISFEGEAYFDVTKKQDQPFIIAVDDMKIKVLGTKFNLYAREKSKTVELVLEEGHVLLSSFKEEKELHPKQKGIFNRLTGEINITTEENPQNASIWKSKKLLFENARLQDVLQTIEENYGVSISLNLRTKMNNDLFSGVIVGDNLLEALEIISLSYHLNYTIKGREISFTDK